LIRREPQMIMAPFLR